MHRRDTHEIPCPQCGYDLRGTRFENCPECGCDVHTNWRKQRHAERKRIHRDEAVTGILTVGASLLAAAVLFALVAIVLLLLRSAGFPILSLAP